MMTHTQPASMLLLYCIALTALLCNGITIATSAGHILHFIRKILDKVFTYETSVTGEIKAYKIYYPILFCIRCMPSLYGTGVCFLLLPITLSLLWQIPLVVFCSVALATILYEWYE